MAKKNPIVIEKLIEDRTHALMLMEADLEGPNKDLIPSQWAQPFAASGKPFSITWGNRFAASGKPSGITWGPRFAASGKTPK